VIALWSLFALLLAPYYLVVGLAILVLAGLAGLIDFVKGALRLRLRVSVL
jgi:hypothetical protein